MIDRRLSSSLTFYMKVALPVLWIGGFVAATVSLFIAARSTPEDPDLQTMKWAFLAITPLGATFLLWFAASLKRVSIEGNHLLVSNYPGEVTVPLAEIERVYESRWISPWRVVIETRTKTDFGRKIVFIPRLRERLKHGIFWSEHPVVKELQTLAAGAGRR